MNLKNLVLITASAGIALIGLGYIVSPDFMLGLYGIEITSVNGLNMIRGAYGGLFIAFSILFLLGVIFPGFSAPSLLALFTFMSGFTLGRFLGLYLDGEPSPLILGLIFLEVIYSVLSGYLLYGYRSSVFPDK